MRWPRASNFFSSSGTLGEDRGGGFLQRAFGHRMQFACSPPRQPSPGIPEEGVRIWVVCVVLLILSGCIIHRVNLPTTQRATAIDPIQATPEYWMDQPAVARISADDFYQLWDACRTEAHSRLFLIDRQDFREGLLTTQPMVSKQAGEFWRSDAVTVHSITESTLATVRRTVRFQLTKTQNGGYIAEPKVLVERFVSSERRLTAIDEYHTAFTGPRPTDDVVTDQSGKLPTDYWYSIGRDLALERDLAAAIQHRIAG
jgi:hypothetical protein